MIRGKVSTFQGKPGWRYDSRALSKESLDGAMIHGKVSTFQGKAVSFDHF